MMADNLLKIGDLFSYNQHDVLIYFGIICHIEYDVITFYDLIKGCVRTLTYANYEKYFTKLSNYFP